MKIVINRSYGGFSISEKAFEMLIKLGWKVSDDWDDEDARIMIDKTANDQVDTKYYFRDNDKNIRTNIDIISVVESLGHGACGNHANLKIIDIPDDIEYTIEEYDGVEWIAEKHRTWS